MSLPAPLSHAFPHIVAEIDANRPLISAALLDVRVTNITANSIWCEVTTEHSYNLLTSRHQRDYLDGVAAKHLHTSTGTFIFDLTPEASNRGIPAPSERDTGSLPVPPPSSEVPASAGSGTSETTVNAAKQPQPPSTAQPSTSPPPPPHRNALRFGERSLLSDWMKLPENTDYVAKHSDADAALRASKDLCFPVSTANITGMRQHLGINKFKPEKPAPLPGDLNLIELQTQLAAANLSIGAIHIQGTGTRDTVNQLITWLNHLKIQLPMHQQATWPHETQLPKLLQTAPGS